MPRGVYKRKREHLLKMKKNGFQRGNPGPVTDIHKKNIGKALKGNTNWDNPNSINTRFKKGVHNNVGINNPMHKITGKDHHNWKNGITPINEKIRHSLEMKLWREAVFARDNWTCQKYGIRGGKLHPHHILNFAEYPELRFAIDNGMTLSEKAHKEFHRTYGTRNNTREQLEEFLL